MLSRETCCEGTSTEGLEGSSAAAEAAEAGRQGGEVWMRFLGAERLRGIEALGVAKGFGEKRKTLIRVLGMRKMVWRIWRWTRERLQAIYKGVILT